MRTGFQGFFRVATACGLHCPFVLSCLHTSSRCSTPHLARVYQPGMHPTRHRRKTEERGVSHPSSVIQERRVRGPVPEGDGDSRRNSQAERSAGGITCVLCQACHASFLLWLPMAADVSRAAQRLLVCICETTSAGGGGAAAATDGRARQGWLITT